MEQQIRFCTTSDGIRIAYATLGDGPPVVRVLGWFTHLELEWQAFRPGIEFLAQDYLNVRYDGRGMGLSDREVNDFSLEAHVRDLEAVLDALSLEQFSLIAWSQGGPTAIRYIVENPERVNRLVLYGSFARNPSTSSHVMDEAILTMMREGWDRDDVRHFFTNLFLPGADPALASFFNEFQRVATPPQNAAAIIDEFMMHVDVTALLPRVTVPTLIIHRRGDTAINFEAGRELAALIPGARFLPLEGEAHAFLPDEPEWVLYQEAVKEFLDEGRAAEPAAAAMAADIVHTILFTDVQGSTALTDRLGDAKARELLREHERIVRDALKAHGGSEVKALGDGFMASFSSATKALECAIALQKAFDERNRSLPAHPEALEGRAEPIRVRIGLNAGEPIAEDDPGGRSDLFGTAVNMAARIASKADGGEILASNVVRELVAGKDFLFADRGDTELRGFEDPVRVYEVSWHD